MNPFSNRTSAFLPRLSLILLILLFGSSLGLMTHCGGAEKPGKKAASTADDGTGDNTDDNNNGDDNGGDDGTNPTPEFPAVNSIAPSDGSADVLPDTDIAVTFSLAMDPATVTTNTGDNSCSGALQVSADDFSTCVIMDAAPATSDNKTFTVTPATMLASLTTYKVRVTTAAATTEGEGLEAVVTQVSGFTTYNLLTTVSEVSSPSVTASTLQSVDLGWTNPVEADFDHVNVYARCSDGETGCAPATFTLVGSTANNTENSLTITELAPGKKFDFKLTAADAGNAQTLGNTDAAISEIQLEMEGDLTLWPAGQRSAGYLNRIMGLTWSGDEIIAASTLDNYMSLLGNDFSSQLIAFDTDPAGNDTNGQYITTYPGTDSKIIWPFRVDFLVEIRAVAGPAIELYIWDAASDSWNPLSSGSGVNGNADMARIPAAALGNPNEIRVASTIFDHFVAHVNYGSFPDNPDATDIPGKITSVTSYYDIGTNVFDLSKSTTALDPAVSPVTEAAHLVHIKLNRWGPSNGTVEIVGDTLPFTWTATDSNLELLDDGTNGDTTSGDGIYEARINFGEYAGEIKFRFVDDGVEEFAMDRVMTLTGSAQTLEEGSGDPFDWGQYGSGETERWHHTITVDGNGTDWSSNEALATSTGGSVHPIYITYDDDNIYVAQKQSGIPQAGDQFAYFLFSDDGSLSSGMDRTVAATGKFGAAGTAKMKWSLGLKLQTGPNYSEFLDNDGSAWGSDVSSCTEVFVKGSGFAEASIPRDCFGGATVLHMTSYIIDYDSPNWLYNMFSGATDGNSNPVDLVNYVSIDTDSPDAPNASVSGF